MHAFCNVIFHPEIPVFYRIGQGDCKSFEVWSVLRKSASDRPQYSLSHRNLGSSGTFRAARMSTGKREPNNSKP